MSVKKTFHLGEIQQGMYMSWFITTQTASLITVRLYDDDHEYVVASKQSTNIEPPLAQDAGYVKGKNLKIEIESNGVDEIRSWHNMSNISSESGDCVGKIFVLACEDYIDSDYNDVYVSISAWNKAN